MTASAPGDHAPTGGSTSSSALDRRALAGLAVLLGLLALAAVLRLQDLASRGTWDADQGHDMLVLRELVRHGSIPLLGPPTSIGDVHHGAWYYYLLAPAALVGTAGDDPLAVVAAIAVAGIAAVGVTWWLARSMAGPVAGLVAGLAMAVSTAAVDELTFIWNPNLIALTSSIALAGAWQAWTTRRARWWLLAAVGVAGTMQCHVLGVVLLPMVGALLVADYRRRSAGDDRRRLTRAAIGAIVILALAYVPLVVHELTSGGSEVAAALAYLASGSGGDGGPAAIPIRLLIVAIRVVSWPLTGLLTDGLVAAVVAVAVIVTIVVWRWRAADASASERVAVRWLGLGLAWTAVALTVAAPSLATIVPGLPNDHYHAFADPMVFTLLGVGAAAAVRTWPRPLVGPITAGWLVVAVLMVPVLGWNLMRQPPGVHPDGGFPAAASAGDRTLAALRASGVGQDGVVLLRSLPDFKSTEAMAYPLVRAGQAVLAETPSGPAPGSVAGTSSGGATPAALVLLCDDLFHETIGASCGGAAEAAVTPDAGGGGSWGPLLDRFEAHPGRWVSVYAAAR